MNDGFGKEIKYWPQNLLNDILGNYCFFICVEHYLVLFLPFVPGIWSILLFIRLFQYFQNSHETVKLWAYILKAEKFAESAFQSQKNLRKKCVNLDIKFRDKSA